MGLVAVGLQVLPMPIHGPRGAMAPSLNELWLNV
jgi:hypothetical protein